jgi:hypothetical protein
VFNNFRIAIARLSLGEPNDVVMLSDSGDSIVVAAYDAQLRPRWSHAELKRKDHLGHYIYPVDLDRDGIDEVVVGPMVLDARGKVRWNRFDFFFDNHDHPDSYRFVDVTGDGRPEIVSTQSEAGVFVFDAGTGRILRQHAGEHAQLLRELRIVDGVNAYSVLVAVAVIDSLMLFRFFAASRPGDEAVTQVRESSKTFVPSVQSPEESIGLREA